MMRRKQRFRGAGASARREFDRQRWANIRGDWWMWLVATTLTLALAAGSLFVSGLAARAVAATAGLLIGVLFVGWSLGGHMSALRWWRGAEGEKATAQEIERLGPEWDCEHDIEHEHGNWDHVLVGPAGVFLLDSKLLDGAATAGNDALRAGRLVYRGAVFRAGAMNIKRSLERRLAMRAPWVQAVVVVWGRFPQQRHEEDSVVYVHGEQLRPWLSQLPATLNAAQRAAAVAALQEVRASLRQATAD